MGLDFSLPDKRLQGNLQCPPAGTRPHPPAYRQTICALGQEA
jgi:hypothetical protein